MECRICGASVPYNAEKCNNCNGFTGYKRKISVDCTVVLENGFTDAYGEKVTFPPFDKVKATQRMKYIKSLDEYKAVSRKSARAELPKLLVAIVIVVLIFILSILILMMGAESIRIVIPVIILGAIGIIFLLRKPLKKDTQEARSETRGFDVHD